MPRRELKRGGQVSDWLKSVGENIAEPGSMILIGSAALLWHAHKRGIESELPDASMDVDPVTDSEAVARLCYEAMIGSEFERTHGWHVNLMPDAVLRELPEGWQSRATVQEYGRLKLVAPSPADLLAPKLRRGEPRDRTHYEWAKRIGLISEAK